MTEQSKFVWAEVKFEMAKKNKIIHNGKKETMLNEDSDSDKKCLRLQHKTCRKST
jgi:hypothetical protein